MKLLLISVRSEVSRGGIATWTDRFLNACEVHGISCTLVNTELMGKRQEKGTAGRSLTDEFVRTRRIFRDLRSALKRESYDAAHLNTSCGICCPLGDEEALVRAILRLKQGDELPTMAQSALRYSEQHFNKTTFWIFRKTSSAARMRRRKRCLPPQRNRSAGTDRLQIPV